MIILMIILASALAGLTCYVALRFENSYDYQVQIVIASLAGGVLQLFISIWIMPAVGFYYYGTWASLIAASLTGAVVPYLISRTATAFFIPAILFIIYLVLYFFLSSEMLHSRAYKSLLGDVRTGDFTSVFRPVDPKKIRLVSRETAIVLAKRVLGQTKDGTVIGSQLEIDTRSAAIQEVKDELWWIFPLDYSGFFKWRNRRTVPGYIRVSAQDPTREADLVDSNPLTGRKLGLKYTRNAYFGEWVDRRAYNRYPFVCHEDITFEVDDNWNPYYVIAATAPHIGFSGFKTRGVIIIDPQTGDIAFRQAGNIPAWIDRVIPLELAYDQIRWWGEYVNGWWNSILGQKDIQMPTAHDLWFIRSSAGKFWFTGMTSVSSKDRSLVGTMMVDTRTGGAVYLPLRGTNEEGVLETVDASLGADSNRWSPAQPIPYNVMGRPTWVLPIISSEGIFQKVALVDISNINTIAVERNLDYAVEKYRVLAAQSYSSDTERTDESGLRSLGPARLVRIGDLVIGGNKTFYMVIEGRPGTLFSANGETNRTKLVALARPGDYVTVTFMDSKSPVIPLEAITIKGIALDLK
jgi:hypothetical protein